MLAVFSPAYPNPTFVNIVTLLPTATDNSLLHDVVQRRPDPPKVLLGHVRMDHRRLGPCGRVAPARIVDRYRPRAGAWRPNAGVCASSRRPGCRPAGGRRRGLFWADRAVRCRLGHCPGKSQGLGRKTFQWSRSADRTIGESVEYRSFRPFPARTRRSPRSLWMSSMRTRTTSLTRSPAEQARRRIARCLV